MRSQIFNHQFIVNQFKIGLFTSYTFMFVGEYKNMLIVLVYVDGEVQHGSMGVEYSVPPKLTFPACEKTTFEDIKSETCRGLGHVNVGAQNNLNIQARYDIGSPGPHYFQLIPLYEERGWNMIFEKTKSRTTWQVIELYVNFTPNQDMLSQVSGGSSIPIIERQSQRYGSLIQSPLHQTSVSAFSNSNTRGPDFYRENASSIFHSG